MDITHFGGHTHTHPILSRLSREQADNEIRTCRDRIAAETGAHAHDVRLSQRPSRRLQPGDAGDPSSPRVLGRIFDERGHRRSGHRLDGDQTSPRGGGRRSRVRLVGRGPQPRLNRHGAANNEVPTGDLGRGHRIRFDERTFGRQARPGRIAQRRHDRMRDALMVASFTDGRGRLPRGSPGPLPRAVLTIGTPVAIASSTKLGIPSWVEVRMPTSSPDMIVRAVDGSGHENLVVEGQLTAQRLELAPQRAFTGDEEACLQSRLRPAAPLESA